MAASSSGKTCSWDEPLLPLWLKGKAWRSLEDLLWLAFIRLLGFLAMLAIVSWFASLYWTAP
jgi:hypothetical protein